MPQDDATSTAFTQTETRSATGLGRPGKTVRVPGLTVLCHPDPERVGEWIALTDLLDGDEVALSRGEPRFAPIERGKPRPLDESHLSRQPIVLKPCSNGDVLVDASATRTHLRVDGTQLLTSRRLTGAELDRGVPLLLGGRILLLLRRAEAAAPVTFDRALVGESSAMMRVREKARRIAERDVPVLLLGETGTGKDVLAHAVHDAGARHARPFRAVNVAEIQTGLVGSELFGHVRGAFTGAVREKDGLFQQADGGTLFLDEIGDAPPEVQTALLRAVETGEVRKVGAGKYERVDVRLIAATEVDLDEAVVAGKFRGSLLQRLSRYTVFLPPLRERLEDFGRLFFHLLRQELAEIGGEDLLREPERDGRPWVSAEIVERLVRCDWPGNVRQLRNVVSHLVLGSSDHDEMVWDPDLDRLLKRPRERVTVPTEAGPAEAAPAEEKPAPPTADGYRNPADVGEEEVLAALAAEDGNVTRAAERLRVSRPVLYKLMKEHGVRKAGDLSREEIEAARERFPEDLRKAAAYLKVSLRGLVLRMKELGLR